MFFSAVTQKLSSVRINAKCSVFLQQQPVEMGCLRCVPPCSTCSVTGEEPIKQGAEYKKETRSKSIRVCCYFSLLQHSKGVGGGEEQEMMQDTPKKTPLTRSSRTLQNTRCKVLSRSGLNSNQPQGRLFCSRPSSLITPSRGGRRREDYLKRINQLRKIIMSCSSCSLSLIIDNFASSHRFLLLNEEVYLEPP